MIWYRHWLEMRVGLWFTAGLWLFMGLTVTGPFHSLRWDSWYAFPWDPFGPELTQTQLWQAIGDQVRVWSEFAGRILVFTFAAVIALAGNGVRSLLFPSEASASYTLTLPVSRTRLVWTRLVAGFAAIVVMGLVASSLGAAILVARGHTVPFVPVAQSFALGVMCFATSMALVGVVLTSLGYWWALLAFMALFVATMVPISYIAAAPVRGEVPWSLLAACLVIILLAVALTAYRTSVQEYG